MKKKISGIILILALFACTLAACAGGVKDAPEINRFTRVDGVTEFEFAKWQTTFDTDYRLSEEGGKTTVEYTKISNESASIYSEVRGGLSYFRYLNFTVSGKDNEDLTGKQAKILISDNPNSSAIVIGKEAIMNFTAGKQTYSFVLTARTMLDNISQISLITQPGRATIFDYGKIVIERSFFSKELPEGAIFANDPANAESPYIKTVDGWKHESNWSNYSLTPHPDGVIVDVAGAADHARIYKDVSPQTQTPKHNYLKFKFKNTNMSISRMRFNLRGDVIGLHESGDYYVYNEQMIGTYSQTNASLKDTEEIELIFPIDRTLDFLEGKTENGLRLLVFIESHPEQAGGLNPQDRYGSMTITGMSTYYEEISADRLMFIDSDGKYGLTDHGDNSFTANYADVAISNWERIQVFKTIEDTDTIAFSVENLGGTDVTFEFRILSSIDPVTRIPLYYAINNSNIADYEMARGEDGGNVVKRTYASGSTTQVLVKFSSALPIKRIDFRIEHNNTNATGNFRVSISQISKTDFDPTPPAGVMAFNNDSGGRYTLASAADNSFNVSYTGKAIGDADRVQITSPLEDANTLTVSITNNGGTDATFRLRLLVNLNTAVAPWKMAAIYYTVDDVKFSYTNTLNGTMPNVTIPTGDTVIIVVHYVPDTAKTPIVRTDLYFNNEITGSSNLDVSLALSTEIFDTEDWAV